MDIIDRIAEFIGPFEGLHKIGPDGLVYPYICPTGHPTQGYGLLVKDLKVPPITKDMALIQFKAAIPRYIKSALQYSPKLTGSQLVALVSFIFNLGPAAYAGSTLRKKVNIGDWEAAAKEIMKWKHGRVNGKLTVLNGLVKRRAAEAALLLET